MRCCHCACLTRGCASSGQQTSTRTGEAAAPSGLELSYLINVGCSSNHRNYLKGFQKGENKSNQTVTVVSRSGAKCVLKMRALFRVPSQFSSIITIIEFVARIKFIKLRYPL